MQNDTHTPSIAQSIKELGYQIQKFSISTQDTASIYSSGHQNTVKQMYLFRLRRIYGVDEEGAMRLAQDTPYSLADLAYANPQFVWKWCLKLDIVLDKPIKHIVDKEELARVEKIIQEARWNSRSYRKKKMERQT